MVAIEADLVQTGTTPTENLKPFHEKHPDIKLDVACYNGPNSYVVAGSTVDIQVLESYLKDKKLNGEKIRFKVLKGMYAYHSILAESIIDESAKLSASILFEVSIWIFLFSVASSLEKSINIFFRNQHSTLSLAMKGLALGRARAPM